MRALRQKAEAALGRPLSWEETARSSRVEAPRSRRERIGDAIGGAILLGIVALMLIGAGALVWQGFRTVLGWLGVG